MVITKKLILISAYDLGNELFLVTHNFERALVSKVYLSSSTSALLNVYSTEFKYLEKEDGGINCRHYAKEKGDRLRRLCF